MAALSNAGGPGPIVDFSAGYDRVSQRLILFGGQTPGSRNGSELSGATWAWDGRSWSELTPRDAPAPEMGASMAVDPVSGRLLLVGGDAYSFSVNAASQWTPDWAPNEGTWLWDGSDWTRVADNPDQGQHPAVAVDESTHQLLANFPPFLDGFGPGMTVADNAPDKPSWYSVNENNVVAWTGSGWTRVTETWGDTGVLADQAAAAYDPISRRVIQFGGEIEGAYSDVLAYDGTTWRFVTDSEPNVLSGPALAFTDESAGQIVMLAGDDGSRALTWTWDGSNWVSHQLAGPPRAVVALGRGQVVWDSAIQHAVLVAYTGSGGLAMWVWTGLTTGWQEIPA